MHISLEQKPPLRLIIIVSIAVLFLSSSLRHFLFNSSGDLAFFDQGIYLISQGQPPISSILGFHVLADHAALILYVLALPYKLYPSVYWLFLVQAVALGIGAWPTYLLSLQAGLKPRSAMLVVFIYLLYPVIYNSNLCDFHPDTLAIPALLTAILMARSQKIAGFMLAIAVILSCKAVFALTVIAMGVWLIWGEGERFFGAIALFSGMAWFIIANYGLIPAFGNELAQLNRHLYRYAYLGSSWAETLKILSQNPELLFKTIFSRANLEYLIFLFLPVFWSLNPQRIVPLIGALPCIGLNLLGSLPSQKNLVLHYSLPVLPFLIVIVISSLSTYPTLLVHQRRLILWSLVCFLVLGKIWFFMPKYFNQADNLFATQTAISLVSSQASVFTTDIITPHLTHRERITYRYDPQTLKTFDAVLLNLRHPGWAASLEAYQSILKQLKADSGYQLRYNQDDVYLWVKP